jgi:hypothetical protein
MIVGFNLSSLNAKVNEDKLGTTGITVNSAPSITGIEKADILDMKDVLRVKFVFAAKFEPDVGEINLEGSLLWRDHDAKKALKMWEEEKKLESKAGLEILNTVFRKCLAKAVVLAEDVRLPPPVQFPVVRAQKAENAE